MLLYSAPRHYGILVKPPHQKVSFLKYLTPPDFCLLDVRRRVEKDVSHWLKSGGVLRGSGMGRGGLKIKYKDSKIGTAFPTLKRLYLDFFEIGLRALVPFPRVPATSG
jgi:hypothetical protein